MKSPKSTEISVVLYFSEIFPNPEFKNSDHVERCFESSLIRCARAYMYTSQLVNMACVMANYQTKCFVACCCVRISFDSKQELASQVRATPDLAAYH
jgi:hypothetical protein